VLAHLAAAVARAPHAQPAVGERRRDVLALGVDGHAAHEAVGLYLPLDLVCGV
jgi:hypothetical protein